MIAHRYNQWTQLQNVCKLLYNCVNEFIGKLPAIGQRRAFKIQDLWRSLAPSIYIMAENIIDMLYANSPIEVASCYKLTKNC